MSIHARSTQYRGYEIIAAGQACDIYLRGASVEHFAHDYHCLDITPDLVLAMLIGEACERIDQRVADRW